MPSRAALLFLALAPFSGVLAQQPGQVNVTDQVQAAPNSFLRVTLQGCGTSQPRVIQNGALTLTDVQKLQLPAVGSTGAVSFYVWPNDEIDCDGVVGATTYAVSYVQNGKPVGEAEIFAIPSTFAATGFNLTSNPPLGSAPANILPGQDFHFRNLILDGALTAQGGTFQSLTTSELNIPNALTCSAPYSYLTGFTRDFVPICAAVPPTQPIVYPSNAATLDVGTPAPLANPWAYGPGVGEGGKYVSLFDSVSAYPAQPSLQIQRNFTASSDQSPDFPGAPGASMPVLEVEGSCAGGHNLQCQAMSGYMVNNGAQDSIGVSGRVYRAAGATSATSGLAEGAGVYGSAYQYSTTPGYFQAGEFSIFQNVPGTSAGDRTPNPYAISLHINSQSTGARANAGIAIDGGGTTGYGYWNGEIMDPTIWNRQNGVPGQGDPGTVAWNGGAWGTAGYPETAIKLGPATQHLWCVYLACIINANNGTIDLFGNSTTAPTTGAGLAMHGSLTNPDFLSFYSGVGSGSIFGASIYYDPTVNAFTVQGQPIDTHINPNGGYVFVPTEPVTDNSQHAASTAFVKDIAPVSFTPQGAIVANSKLVSGSFTIGSGGSVLVVFAQGAVFTSASTYVCVGTDTAQTNAVRFLPSSGSGGTLYGTPNDAIYVICTGS